jgi:hypothetical protein|tara:strand:- start:54 stop:797 length:744 start_codon:yes stop_codon:yes gene_type:complete
MPQYERYEGESQEAADARIAKNKQRDMRESDASRQMAYDYEAELRHDMDQILESRPESVNKAVAHINRKRQERENMANHPEWAEMGQEIERSEYNSNTTSPIAGEKSYPTALREGGYDIHKKNFNYIIDNMPEDAELSEIIGWDDEMGRDEVGLYAVRTADGIKFVHGLTDRYHGYGKSGNPNYKTSAEAKYGSAKQKAANGDFLTYEKAYKIYRRQAKGSIVDKFIQHFAPNSELESRNSVYMDEE